MGKKKQQKKAAKPSEYQSNPFSGLKGFAVSAKPEAQPQAPQPEPQTAAREESAEELFAREMDFLGVERVDGDPQPVFAEPKPEAEKLAPPAKKQTEQEQFLEAMGEMQVRFEESLPQEDEPPQASPRRMKLLKQGKLRPEATLDLHGLLSHQVVEKLRFFLQDAAYQGLRTLLVITGRGLHSDAGEPVLRNEAERYLASEGKALVAEWGRAPRQYGGDGALVLFLRNGQQT